MTNKPTAVAIPEEKVVVLTIAFVIWIPNYWSLCNEVAARVVYLGTLLTPQIDYLGYR